MKETSAEFLVKEDLYLKFLSKNGNGNYNN